MPYVRLRKFIQSHLQQLTPSQRKFFADNPPQAMGYGKSAEKEKKSQVYLFVPTLQIATVHPITLKPMSLRWRSLWPSLLLLSVELAKEPIRVGCVEVINICGMFAKRKRRVLVRAVDLWLISLVIVPKDTSLLLQRSQGRLKMLESRLLLSLDGVRTNSELRTPRRRKHCYRTVNLLTLRHQEARKLLARQRTRLPFLSTSSPSSSEDEAASSSSEASARQTSLASSSNLRSDNPSLILSLRALKLQHL